MIKAHKYMFVVFIYISAYVYEEIQFTGQSYLRFYPEVLVQNNTIELSFFTVQVYYLQFVYQMDRKSSLTGNSVTRAFWDKGKSGHSGIRESQGILG